MVLGLLLSGCPRAAEKKDEPTAEEEREVCEKVCAFKGRYPGHMHLRTRTVELLWTASREASPPDSFTIVCTVLEGPSCEVRGEGPAQPLKRTLAQETVRQLDPKSIEQSAGYEVTARCHVKDGRFDEARCERDRGNGFGGLPVGACD